MSIEAKHIEIEDLCALLITKFPPISPATSSPVAPNCGLIAASSLLTKDAIVDINKNDIEGININIVLDRTSVGQSQTLLTDSQTLNLTAQKYNVLGLSYAGTFLQVVIDDLQDIYDNVITAIATNVRLDQTLILMQSKENISISIENEINGVFSTLEDIINIVTRAYGISSYSTQIIDGLEGSDVAIQIYNPTFYASYIEYKAQVDAGTPLNEIPQALIDKGKVDNNIVARVNTHIVNLTIIEGQLS